MSQNGPKSVNGKPKNIHKYLVNVNKIILVFAFIDKIFILVPSDFAVKQTVTRILTALFV